MTGGFHDWIEVQRTRPPAPTPWWYATFIFGLFTALFSVHLGQVFPAEAAAMHPGYGTPVLALEFARNEADLFAIFGAEGDPMQVARLAAMRLGNEQDYIFMLLYGIFLASGCYGLWRELRLRWLLAAVALPVVAALCDAYENWLLLDIQAAFTLGDYSPVMASLPYPVAAKFLALTLTNVAIGYAMMQMGRWWQFAGTLILIPCLATIMALIAPAAFGWTLTAAIGAGWFGLLVMAAIGSWFALGRNQPLVDFEPDAPRRREAVSAEPEVSLAPDRRRHFGRRGDDRGI
ncbi:MAG: hypothetical protein JNL35_10075 [Sphingopyxis sp.]|nr:hypothetical protein [Sphingopyxis sp.]